jgi:hypothetical protein
MWAATVAVEPEAEGEVAKRAGPLSAFDAHQKGERRTKPLKPPQYDPYTAW